MIDLNNNNLNRNFSDRLQFYVNNDYKDLETVDPKTTLLTFLRSSGYVGTKYGCGEGGCGACCVVVGEFHPSANQIRYRTVNSCLMPLCAAYGKQIITVEGIGCPEKPHPIQERLAKGNASQCGFCTPGFVMSLYGLLKINPNPSLSDIEETFDGNLCRCTGYRSILDSARSFVKKEESSCEKPGRKMLDFDEFKDYDPNAEPVFPLVLTKYRPDSSLLISDDSSVWFRPSDLNDLLLAKQMWPEARIVGGNSEVGVEMNLKPLSQPNRFIYVGDLLELREVRIHENRLEIGVNITLTELINSLRGLKETAEEHQKPVLDAFLSNLRWFASRHIRNFATLAGNITTGSPISDLNPILVATNAILTVCSKSNGERSIQMREFFLAYRKINMKPDEVLVKVSVPLPDSHLEIVSAYKQAKRRVDDIALVNGCFRVALNNEFKVVDLDVALGGVSFKTIYLNKLSGNARGLKWGDEAALKTIEKMVLDEVTIDYSAPGGHPTYRRALVVSFLYRFWYQTAKRLDIHKNIDPRQLKNIDEIEREISSSSQDVFSNYHEPHLGNTTPHLAAILHTTGVATYTDDIPKQAGELVAWPVMSTKSHAIILSVDESKALAVKGVHAFITHKDVPVSNIWGIGKDEEYFASERVVYHGQLIGLILAETASSAKIAANLVQVNYQELKPIITIDDAIEADSFFDSTKSITVGAIDESTFEQNSDDLVHEGCFEIGCQEHFYLETVSCLIIPKRECNELEIISTTQNPTEVQESASHALGIPSNRIISRCKRLGGGFGGKETRPGLITIACCVAAKKINRPVRCVLDRDLDMAITGKRHSFKFWYKVRVSRDGFFKAFDLNAVSNGGHSLDLSDGVLSAVVFHSDGVYKFPNMRVTGRIAKTNIPSNTAFRAFGRPQALSIVETMVTEVAEKLGIDQTKIRSQNMLKENDLCFVNQRMTDWHVPEMFEKVLENIEYVKTRDEIERFNRDNRWKKRGLAVTPMKYGLGFGLFFLNQGAALCNIYLDGTVSIHTPGVEMGQGLHTKLIHVAANVLDIPESQIYITEVSTNTVPNGVPTAASVATDLQGAAVLNACEILAKRLKPYRDQNPNGGLKSWATAAFIDRVSLSANGFFKRPNTDYDISTNTGHCYSYYTTGVSASIVELDVLTGDHTILRSDLFVDLGRSINYSIDVGQVEGAFTQGIGLYTIEEVLQVTSNGALATKGPGAYKIPTAEDIPQQFNVNFLKDKEYKSLDNLKKSKGIGEPAVLLAFSVFLALREAVSYARKENGLQSIPFTLNSPATCESLRLACGDHLVEAAKVIPSEKEKLFYTRP